MIHVIPLYKEELRPDFVDNIAKGHNPLGIVLKQLFQLKAEKPIHMTILEDNNGEVNHIATIGTLMSGVIDEGDRVSRIQALNADISKYTYVLSSNVSENELSYDVSLVLYNHKSKCHNNNFHYKFRHEGFMELFKDAYGETMKNEFKRRLLDDSLKIKMKKYFKVATDTELYNLDISNPKWATMTEFIYQDLHNKHNLINDSVGKILTMDSTSIYHSLKGYDCDVAIILPNGCGCFERHNGLWFFSDYTLNKITFKELSTIIAKYLITHTQFTPSISYKRSRTLIPTGGFEDRDVLIINFIKPLVLPME
ncbi:MAG: hypothetical protein ACRC92_26335 [Peptostreptococcaceae bacterium]